MKTLILAAALTMGVTGMAQAQTDPNGPGVPPGDGITRLGNNPDGIACTPAGFNQGMSAYPACSALTPQPAQIQDYPRCTRQRADRCVQAYTGRA